MSSDRRQGRLIRPSKHQAREAWLRAREVARMCQALVTKAAADLKAAKEALSSALAAEADNADEWEGMLLEEHPELADTRPAEEVDGDPLRT